MKKTAKSTTSKLIHQIRGNKEAKAIRFAISSSRIEGIKPSPALRKKMNVSRKSTPKRS